MRRRNRRRARRGRVLVVAGVLVVGLALVGVVAIRSSRAPSTRWRLPIGTVGGPEVRSRAGLAAGVEILWESDAAQARDFDAIAATGAKWTTLDVDWNSIQGDGPESFRWDRAMDRAVLDARTHGLTIIGVAAYSPPWARGPECPPDEVHCLPADPQAYARFVTAAAARYGNRAPAPLLRGAITTWQIWNEPNHQEYAQPKPDLDRYAAMLRAAYVGIKTADPDATVITGGTAPAPDAADGTDYQPATWLRGLYARGARGSFDGVGHHPYAFPFNPLDPQPWNAYTQTTTLHDVMARHGDGAKLIWGTEIGAATGTDPEALSEAEQAQWVRDYYLGWNTKLRGITGPLVWMPVRDTGTDRAAKWDNTGLLRHDHTPKPAYGAYRAVMRHGT